MITAAEANKIASKAKERSVDVIWAALVCLIEENAKAGLYSRLVSMDAALEKYFLAHQSYQTLLCSGYKMTKLRQTASEVVYEISWR